MANVPSFPSQSSNLNMRPTFDDEPAELEIEDRNDDTILTSESNPHISSYVDEENSPTPSEPDDTNYMALHYASKQENREQIVERIARKSRPRTKTKITSSVLTQPSGLCLLAKRCRQLRRTRIDEGKIEIQLYRVLEMYDEWAKQLCPGHDLDTFYSKIAKFGNDRLVRDQAEELIAGRHVENLDVIAPHTSASREAIQKTRIAALQSYTTSTSGSSPRNASVHASAKAFLSNISTRASTILSESTMPVPGATPMALQNVLVSRSSNLANPSQLMEELDTPTDVPHPGDFDEPPDWKD